MVGHIRLAYLYLNIITDPPIKRFAQRHSYLNIDGIANRDLGFAVSKQSLTRTDTVPTVITGASSWVGPSSSQSPLQATSSMSSKRQSSPDRLARREERFAVKMVEKDCHLALGRDQ